MVPITVRAGWVALCALLISLSLTLPSGVRAQAGNPSALITLDADDIAVNGVLQILADRGGLNIVTSPEVQNRRISIHLRNTRFDEALNLVVRSAGLGYERVGKSILVADNATLMTETGLVTRVFELQHANAGELRAMLEVLCKGISANAAGNRLVIHATQSTIEQAEEIITQLDRKPAQILLEARMIEVNTTALLEAGIDWEKITKWNTVVTEGVHGTSAPGQLPEKINFVKADETADYHRQMATFEVVLDALLTDGNANLLANSKVVTLDGKPAEIFAGETVPVVITSLSSAGAAGGVMQTVQLEKIDVGVKLAITPRIGEGEYITAVVEPELSRITRFVGPDNDLPQTSTRRARTLVRVRDGEKIYIGGLLSDERRRTVKKVPLLGRIPIIGYLFSHVRDDVAKLDLVIEIVPRIVGDAGASLPTPEAGEAGGQ